MQPLSKSTVHFPLFRTATNESFRLEMNRSPFRFIFLHIADEPKQAKRRQTLPERHAHIFRSAHFPPASQFADFGFRGSKIPAREAFRSLACSVFTSAVDSHVTRVCHTHTHTHSTSCRGRENLFPSGTTRTRHGPLAVGCFSSTSCQLTSKRSPIRFRPRQCGQCKAKANFSQTAPFWPRFGHGPLLANGVVRVPRHRVRPLWRLILYPLLVLMYHRSW